MAADSRQQRAKARHGPKKPPPRIVPSDDCVVTVDGVEYHPHEGESVSIAPGYSVGDLQLQHELQALRVKLDAIAGDDDEGARQVAILDNSYTSAIEVLSARLLGWTWTDDAGDPLPQPHKAPSAFSRLRLDEIYYLIQAVKGETPGEQKNGSRPSRTSSSATARQPSQA